MFSRIEMTYINHFLESDESLVDHFKFLAHTFENKAQSSHSWAQHSSLISPCTHWDPIWDTPSDHISVTEIKMPYNQSVPISVFFLRFAHLF